MGKSEASVDIEVPAVGEAITEGRLSAWLKSDGDYVEEDEPLFELETDKASTEVPAPTSGVLRVKTPEGEMVSIGAVVGSIEPGEAPANGKAEKEPKSEAKPAEKAEPAGEEPKVAPAARGLIAERGLDANAIKGTGRGGLITKEDVAGHGEPRASATGGKPAPVADAPRSPKGGERRERMSSIRARIASRLVESQHTTATLTTFNECDLSSVMALRSKYKELFKEKHEVGLGFMSFFVKAAVSALKAFPLVNARIDGDEVVFQDFHDVGVAVSTEKGLMVPVVRGADSLSFADVEKEIVRLAGKARDGKVTIDDLQGGTFTITNGGIFGSLLSTPILNLPQCAILGMHTIQKRPVVVNDEIVVRPMMYLALSYDHRLIDGREAVQFLVHIKECVEQPERMLLGV